MNSLSHEFFSDQTKLRWVTKHGKNHLRSILADDQFPNGVINNAAAPLEIWINYTSRALNLSVMNAPKDQYYTIGSGTDGTTHYII